MDNTKATIKLYENKAIHQRCMVVRTDGIHFVALPLLRSLGYKNLTKPGYIADILNRNVSDANMISVGPEIFSCLPHAPTKAQKCLNVEGVKELLDHCWKKKNAQATKHWLINEVLPVV